MPKVEDNKDYTNRIEIKSSSSKRIYIIAQHRSKRWWSCSCPGWISRRKCKHLKSMGLPPNQEPYEMNKFTDGYKTYKDDKKGTPEDWAKELEGLRPPEKVVKKIERKFDLEED